MSLDPITLSVLRSALAGIAEEMGSVLVRSAYSSNIKERRDCSAALFDADARMVAQAEHIPVHLGAMPESVAAVRARGAVPGETWILNDPYTGGTHLPDVTLVTPVGIDGRVVAYAVTRAHHSDVGGMSPGSMPADSRDLWQEGLVIPPVRLTDEVMELVCANSRTPRLRRGDFRAQAAANRVGGQRVAELAGRFGLDTLLAGFDEVLAYAERRTREALRALPDGVYRAADRARGRWCQRRGHPDPGSGHDRWRPCRDRPGRQRRCGRRQRQLPARGDPVGVLLRAARAAAGGRTGVRRDLRPARDPRARGVASSTPGRRTRWWPATSRPASG